MSPDVAYGLLVVLLTLGVLASWVFVAWVFYRSGKQDAYLHAAKIAWRVDWGITGQCIADEILVAGDLQDEDLAE